MAPRQDESPRPSGAHLASWAALALAVAAIVGLGMAPGRWAPALVDEPRDYPNVAFVGDSYTQGLGASEPDKRWTSLVSQRMGWNEHNFGRGGTGYLASSRYGPNYLGMLDQVAASNPDIVVVSGGQNDRTPFEQNDPAVPQAITSTFSELRNRLPNVRIVAVGPSYPGPTTPSLIALSLDVENAARAVGGEYVSLIAPMPVVQEEMIIPDRLHVDDSGHAAIADRVVSVLRS
jgi:lysophospholipase L1-like esterase